MSVLPATGLVFPRAASRPPLQRHFFFLTPSGAPQRPRALLTLGFRCSPGCSSSWPCLLGKGLTGILRRQEARPPEPCGSPATRPACGRAPARSSVGRPLASQPPRSSESGNTYLTAAVLLPSCPQFELRWAQREAAFPISETRGRNRPGFMVHDLELVSGSKKPYHFVTEIIPRSIWFIISV